MPLPTIIDIDKIFFPTILNKSTHLDYERVCAIAKDYTAYTTGEGIDEKLSRFNMRETVEMFEQRCRLTKSITPDISNSIMNPMFKIGRTPATISMIWGNNAEDTEKKKALTEAAAKFNGKQSVDNYLTYRMAELDATDPNSFIVVEFEGEADANKPKSNTVSPYPFEVNSHEAVDYFFDNNVLQYLTVLIPIKIKNKDGKHVPGSKYTQYLAENSIVATQIHFDLVGEYLRENPDTILYEAGMELKETVNDKSFIYLFNSDEEKEEARTYYLIQVFKHGIPFVPAKRVGISRDLVTRGRTCVPVMHPAQSYFEKSIKQCSEFDLTNALHTFPQKLQYSDPCPGFEETENNFIPCNNGISTLGGQCRACKGTGYKVHTSSQDMLQFRLPKDPKDMISLENLLIYKSPPIDLLEFQKKYVEDLRAQAIRAVYNSDVFTPDQTQVTATEKTIDLEAVYDTLQSFAKNYSDCWNLIMQSIAYLKDIGENLTTIHQFPVDFKMKSLSALIADLTAIGNNNAPSHIKKAISQDITRKIYVDSPDEIKKIETKDMFFPFPGKNSSEITFCISNDLTTTRNKILYANFDQIFSELESENEGFYMMVKAAQKELIDAKVEEILTEIEEEMDQSVNTAFNPPGTPTKVDPAPTA